MQTNDVLYAVFDTNAETIKLHFDFTQEDLVDNKYSVLPTITGLDTDFGRLSVMSKGDKNYYIGSFYSNHGYRYFSIANLKVTVDGVEHSIPNNGLFWFEDDPFYNEPILSYSGSSPLLFQINGENYKFFYYESSLAVKKVDDSSSNAYVSSVDFFLISENESRYSEFIANYFSFVDGIYPDNGEILPVEMINITIDGVNFQAEKGMTFEEWIDSEYNTSNYVISDEGYILKYSGSLNLKLHPTGDGYYSNRPIILSNYMVESGRNYWFSN